MENPLAGKKIAILVANGFEETDMTGAQRALLAAGAKVSVISPEQGLVNGWHDQGWGHYFPVDAGVDTVMGSDLDGVIVPGGERSVAKLAENGHTGRILRSVIDYGKPCVFVHEAVGLLATIERAEGRSVAAPASVAATLSAAGATVVEAEELEAENILTLAAPLDADALGARLISFLAPGETDLRDAA